jgi:2-polyprenyl-3-methyl-5-hydroxy-6-metoxy-1,4-benzoquinol methylase
MPTACPLCAGATYTPHLTVNGFTLVRCATCGLIYVNPMPDAETLRAHYSNPAYFAGQADQGYADYTAMHKALHPHFERRLDQLAARRPPPGRLLDFGCADGFFLQLARARGWQISGVELSAEMAQTASATLGIPVATDLAALPAGDFDAITLWEVVEHLPAPLDTLRTFYKRLRPGGVLMLSTPNTGHWQAQRRPDLWISYRPPSHLLYFTARTLTDALERAGFTQVSVERTMPLPPLPGWLDRLTKPLQRAVASGQTGQWALTLFAWRAVRALAWLGGRLSGAHDDVYVTLVATATRPA